VLCTGREKKMAGALQSPRDVLFLIRIVQVTARPFVCLAAQRREPVHTNSIDHINLANSFPHKLY